MNDKEEYECGHYDGTRRIGKNTGHDCWLVGERERITSKYT